MILIYILLTIIAIGVLLASEAGKELLALLIKLTLIVGGLYFGFWIIIIAISIFTGNSMRSFISGASQQFAGIMDWLTWLIMGIYLIAIFYLCGKYLFDNLKEKEKRVKVWRELKSGIKTYFAKEWKQHRIRTIFLIPSLVFFVFFIIMIALNGIYASLFVITVFTLITTKTTHDILKKIK